MHKMTLAPLPVSVHWRWQWRAAATSFDVVAAMHEPDAVALRRVSMRLSTQTGFSSDATDARCRITVGAQRHPYNMNSQHTMMYLAATGLAP